MLALCVIRCLATTQSQNCMRPPSERHGTKITCFFRLRRSNMTIENECNCRCGARNVMLSNRWECLDIDLFSHLNVIAITATPPPNSTFCAAFDHRNSPEGFLCFLSFFLSFRLIFHFTIRPSFSLLSNLRCELLSSVLCPFQWYRKCCRASGRAHNCNLH